MGFKNLSWCQGKVTFRTLNIPDFSKSKNTFVKRRMTFDFSTVGENDEQEARGKR